LRELKNQEQVNTIWGIHTKYAQPILKSTADSSERALFRKKNSRLVTPASKEDEVKSSRESGNHDTKPFGKVAKQGKGTVKRTQDTPGYVLLALLKWGVQEAKHQDLRVREQNDKDL